MKKNLGGADRIVRILAAIAIIILWFTNVISRADGIVLMVLPAVLIWTAFMSYCPLYRFFGMRSNRRVT